MEHQGIIYAGQTLPAYTCKTCGARDTNPDMLAIHELRHGTESARCKVTNWGDVALAMPVKCASPGCGVYTTLKSGLCKGCDYKREYWSRKAREGR